MQVVPIWCCDKMVIVHTSMAVSSILSAFNEYEIYQIRYSINTEQNEWITHYWRASFTFWS